MNLVPPNPPPPSGPNTITRQATTPCKVQRVVRQQDVMDRDQQAAALLDGYKQLVFLTVIQEPPRSKALGLEVKRRPEDRPSPEKAVVNPAVL